MTVGSEGTAFTQPSGGRDFVQRSYHIMECTACGLLYRDEALADAELAAYYAGLRSDHWEYTSFTPPERWIGGFLGSLTPGARVLDFGCSSGRLLEPWARTHVCHGHEINEAASAKAAARGLSMLSEEDLMAGRDGAFDVIILVDVFEHLRRPSEMLSRLWRLLAPGGRLVISTGNGDHWACRLDPAQFWYFRNLEHLCMLTAGYAESLSRRLGGRCEVWAEMSHYDVPLHARLRLHMAHALYWLMRAVPRGIRTVAGAVPRLGRVVKWENAPNYGCSRDHVVWVVQKAGGRS